MSSHSTSTEIKLRLQVRDERIRIGRLNSRICRYDAQAVNINEPRIVWQVPDFDPSQTPIKIDKVGLGGPVSCHLSEHPLHNCIQLRT